MEKERRRVVCRAYLDEILQKEWEETRMVYKRADGTEYINYLHTTRDLVNGVAEYRAKTIQGWRLEHHEGSLRQMTKHTADYKREHNVVYQLNKFGVNRFYVSVQAGYTDEDTRTPQSELDAIAQMFAAAPTMLAALKKVLAVHEGCYGDTAEPIWLQDVRAAIALAEPTSKEG